MREKRPFLRKEVYYHHHQWQNSNGYGTSSNAMEVCVYESKILNPQIMIHTYRTTAFTLEKSTIKTGYIFEIYRFRRTFWRKDWNRIYCRFWEKLISWFLALTLENMFSVIALDPDGISKKFLCLNNFSFNSRTSFAFANFR